MKYSLSYTLITRVTGFLARTAFPFRKAELHYMMDALEHKDNITILDYGCNTGYLLNMIKQRYPHKNFTLCGTDINKHALKYAQDKYNDFTFYNIDENLFAKKFDIVILSHVLEHIHKRDEFITDLKKLLKENGTLIVAVPQERIRGDCTIVQLLYNYMRLRFENPHVVKIFYKDLNQLLQRNGMEISNYTYTNFFYPIKSNNKKIHSWSLVALCNKKVAE